MYFDIIWTDFSQNTESWINYRAFWCIKHHPGSSQPKRQDTMRWKAKSFRRVSGREPCFLLWLLLIHVPDFSVSLPWCQLISWPFIWSWFSCHPALVSSWIYVALLACSVGHCIHTGHHHRLCPQSDSWSCCFLHSLVQLRITSPF